MKKHFISLMMVLLALAFIYMDTLGLSVWAEPCVRSIGTNQLLFHLYLDLQPHQKHPVTHAAARHHQFPRKHTSGGCVRLASIDHRVGRGDPTLFHLGYLAHLAGWKQISGCIKSDS